MKTAAAAVKAKSTQYKARTRNKKKERRIVINYFVYV